MLKELRKAIGRNVDHCNKKLGTIKRSQSELENTTAKIKTKLKTTNRKLNNTEEWISDLEDRNGNHPFRIAARKTNLKNTQYRKLVG